MAAAEPNRASTMTLDTLRTAFHQPREQAAETLGLTVNELKKALKLLGVARWPFRKLASLQSLHQDLEAQLQQFAGMAESDPSVAAHVNDLKEMQARIAEDSAKIMADPNHPLDESLHKLRLQNYKARFMGKHGLTTVPPRLKLAPASAATTSAGAVGAADLEDADGPSGSAMEGDAASLNRRLSEGDVAGSSGRRRRAASIAASSSIKRAAGLVSAGSDDDDMSAPVQRSRSNALGARSAGRVGLLRTHGGYDPLATLPSLPEGHVYADSMAAYRLAQSAPLYDEAGGGPFGWPTPLYRGGLASGGGSGQLSALNEGVAAISLRQQQQQQQQQQQHMAGGSGVCAGPSITTGLDSGKGASSMLHHRPHPIPSHLLPKPQAVTGWPGPTTGAPFSTGPPITTGVPSRQGGMPYPGFGAGPYGGSTMYGPSSSTQHSHYTDASSSASTAYYMTAQQRAMSQPVLRAPAGTQTPGTLHDGSQPVPGSYGAHAPRAAHGAPGRPRLPAESAPVFGGFGGYPGGYGQQPVSLPVAEPLITPLEQLLDEMMAGSGQHAASSQPGAAASGPFGASSLGGSTLAPAQATGSLGGFQPYAAAPPGAGQTPQHHHHHNPSAPLKQHAPPHVPSHASHQGAAGPTSAPIFAGVGGLGYGPGGVQGYGMAGDASLRNPASAVAPGLGGRVPNSHLFLLNDDEEEDAVLRALLASPNADTRLLGGAASAMTLSVADARTSALFVQRAAALEARHRAVSAELARTQQQRDALAAMAQTRGSPLPPQGAASQADHQAQAQAQHQGSREFEMPQASGGMASSVYAPMQLPAAPRIPHQSPQQLAWHAAAQPQHSRQEPASCPVLPSVDAAVAAMGATAAARRTTPGSADLQVDAMMQDEPRLASISSCPRSGGDLPSAAPPAPQYDTLRVKREFGSPPQDDAPTASMTSGDSGRPAQPASAMDADLLALERAWVNNML